MINKIKRNLLIWKNNFQIHLYALDWAFPLKMNKYWQAVEKLRQVQLRETRIKLHNLIQQGEIKKVRDENGDDRYYPNE